jgi:hypothetical protein
MYLGLGLRFGGANTTDGTGGGSGITAPVLARTSSDGASPLTWTTTIDDTVYAGYFWRLQVDQTSSAFGAITQDISQMITPSEIAALDGSFPTFIPPSGLYYMRIRVEIDDGASGPGSGTNSAWSNVLTDTITAASTTLSTSVKHRSLTLSGTPKLVATGLDWNAPQPVQATSSRTSAGGGFYGFEVTYTTKFSGGKIFAGFADPAMTDYGAVSGFPEPGVAPNAALGMVAETGGQIKPSNTGIATFAQGDIMGVWLRPGTGKMWISKNGTFLNGDPVAQTGGETLALSTFFPVVGTFRADVLTCNFGQSAFANTPSGGSPWL